MIVLDASVAVKWYFPETGSDDAIDILNDQATNLVAPDIFAVEVNAALVRKGNMDKSQYDGVCLMIADFEVKLVDMYVELIRTSIAAHAKAASIALNIGHPLKDCIYIVLAMELGCQLVTCDAKFAVKARRVWDHVRVLEA